MASDETEQALGTHPIEAREGGIMDDVLERAKDHAMVYAHFHSASSDYHQVTFHLIAALAAEVRELRKDRERLDWIERCLEDDTPLVRWSDGSWSVGECGRWVGPACETARAAIDAARSAVDADAAKED